MKKMRFSGFLNGIKKYKLSQFTMVAAPILRHFKILRTF